MVKKIYFLIDDGEPLLYTLDSRVAYKLKKEGYDIISVSLKQFLEKVKEMRKERRNSLRNSIGCLNKKEV
jgi:hypothetical protein